MLGGRELHLEPAEFDLLVLVMAHPKQLVTSRTLLSTRWQELGVRQSQFIRVLMSLRSKLEVYGSYVRTEIGIFYRFDPKPM